MSVVATKNIIDAVKVNFESISNTLSLSENVYNSICFRAFGFQQIEIWKKQKQTLRSLSLMCKKMCVVNLRSRNITKHAPGHTWYLSVWFIVALFKPVKSTPKRAYIRYKIGQIGPKRP